MLPEVNAPDYLKQVRLYGDVWTRLAALTQAEPTISERIKALLDAGFLKHQQVDGLAPRDKFSSRNVAGL
jgi:hypothetical protein